MTVDDELFKKANVVFSIEGGGVRERAAGQFAKSGTTAWNIGTGPRMEYIESPTAHNFREISGGPKASRAATSSLFRDGMQKQGKAWRKMLKNMPSEIDKLRSMPDRIALTALEANAAKNKTYGLRKYLEMTVPYVNQHAGGIIGDTIKEEYFQAGRMKWQPLAKQTIINKTKYYTKYGSNVPRPGIPLFGVTFTPTLPDGWQMFTYRWNNWPASGGPKEHKLPHLPISTYMNVGAGKSSKVRTTSGFFSQPYKMKRKGKLTGATAYPPHMRGTALMDVVAHLAPVAMVTYPYSGRGYKAALKAAAANPGTTKNAEMKIDGVIQPFYVTPYVFYHEDGSDRFPARPFISTGLAEGMGRVELVLHKYLEDGKKNFNRAYRETEFEEIKDLERIEALYRAGSDKAGDAMVRATVTGKAGLSKEPLVTKFDWQFDSIIRKHNQMKGIIRRLFGNHLIWWFVPPSKYWHYIGLASDIRGFFFGKKNFGAAKAYVSAMSIGIAGARAGTPVPFTPKARRRKFRKSLYSRAGYHRKTVGGRA